MCTSDEYREKTPSDWPRCDVCGERVHPDFICWDTDECDTCADERFQREYAHLKPLYEAEKAAGLTKTKEGLDEDLRQAGRGHLVRRD